MISFDAWCATGARTPVTLRGAVRRVWMRRCGVGPTITFLHGFPTASADWADVVAALPDVDALLFDFLGFGDSDKPADHDYTLQEQGDLTEAVWAHHGVRRTLVVAHDYAVSVAQELLARQAEGPRDVEITGVVFLNGGLYPDLHRALPAQEMLLDPEQGPRLSALVSEETFSASLAMTFPQARPPAPAVLHEMWRSAACRDGHRLGYRLIRYITCRRQHATRWTTALERANVPRRFVWGMQDPVSGGHVVPRLRERLPHAPITCLDEVGHWPAIEAPAAVVEEIRTALAEM